MSPPGHTFVAPSIWLGASARKREATTRGKNDVDLDADTQVATTATA